MPTTLPRATIRSQITFPLRMGDGFTTTENSVESPNMSNAHCCAGTSTESLPTPAAAKRVTSSVSARLSSCPIACSKKKCEVRAERFSQRTVPRLANGRVCPGVGVVV